MRCGINNFRETRFVASNGLWQVGSTTELEQPWRGLDKLAKMVARAIEECFAAATGEAPERIPVLICVAEPERPGRFPGIAGVILQLVADELGMRLHPHSRVFDQGRVGGAVAVLQARRMLAQGQHGRMIVAGVDSFLTASSIEAFNREDRLLTQGAPNGFIPGEAAGAVLLAQGDHVPPTLLLRGLGFAREPAPFGSGEPLRADGLVLAIRAAMNEAGAALCDCDFRITDANGEQSRFKEAALAVTRLLRDRKMMFPLWHPADCLGEIGAATLPAMLAVLFWGARKGYLPGATCLAHLSNDDEKRAALLAQAIPEQPLALEAAAETTFSTKRRSGTPWQ
jgi:3-oxoacyl-[acyl-carrier-protein] synthase I